MVCHVSEGFVVCTTSWGIGTCFSPDHEFFSYGFPFSGMRAEDFHPDAECCHPNEIEAYAWAKRTQTRHSEFTVELYENLKEMNRC